MSNFFTKFIAKIESLFTNPKVESVFDTIAHLVTLAEPVVAQIAAAVPNKTVQEITSAFATFGVPTAVAIENNPTAIGNAMLNLGTAIVQKTVPTAANNIVQTAVQIAVTAAKAAAVGDPVHATPSA